MKVIVSSKREAMSHLPLKLPNSAVGFVQVKRKQKCSSGLVRVRLGYVSSIMEISNAGGACRPLSNSRTLQPAFVMHCM